MVELPNGEFFMLARTGTNRLWQSFSRDGGLTWETPSPSPLTSPNTPGCVGNGAYGETEAFLSAVIDGRPLPGPSVLDALHSSELAAELQAM